MSMLSQAFSVIIDHVISEPGHVRELVDILNGIDKKVSIPVNVDCASAGAKNYNRKMVMHTGICTSDVSLAR